MKKILSLLLVLTLVFTLAACNKDSPSLSNTDTSTTQSDNDSTSNITSTESTESNTTVESSSKNETVSKPIESNKPGSASNIANKPIETSELSSPTSNTNLPCSKEELENLFLIISPGQCIETNKTENENDGVTFGFATNKQSKLDVKKIEIVSAKINGKETSCYQTDNTEKFNHIFAEDYYQNTNEFFENEFFYEGLTNFKELKTIAFVHVSYIMMLQHSSEEIDSSVDVILTVRCTLNNNQFIEKTITKEVWAGAGGFFVLPNNFN